MQENLDVLKLAQEVRRVSQSGELHEELLAKGQTLYGKSADYPDYIVRTTPDGKKSLGQWRNGEFAEKLSINN